MPKKRTSLENVFSPPAQATAVQEPLQVLPAEREKKRQLAVYLPLAVYEQLRTLAFEERQKMHHYLIEGLSLAFKKRGLKSVEELIQENK